MSDLPDLDTSAISTVCFWNAISDGGVSSIDPTEATNDGNLKNVTYYDNGIEGDYRVTLDSNGLVVRDAKVRVKNDGWFVAYLDDSFESKTSSFVPSTKDEYTPGRWDNIHFPFGGFGGGGAGKQGPLSDIIDSIRSNLSNGGTMTFNTSDVGIKDYVNPDATTITYLALRGSGNETTYNWSYTDSTDILAHEIRFVGKDGNDNVGYVSNTSIDWDNTTIMSGNSNDNSYKMQTYDGQAAGLTPSAGSTVDIYFYGANAGDIATGQALLWK